MRKKLIPRQRKKMQKKVSPLIQGYLRGYTTRMKHKMEVEEMKRDKVYEYFAKIKYEMEHDAIVKIKYQMKKFMNRMRRKRMEAEFAK